MEDHTLRCPACSEGVLDILTEQLNIPHFGEVLISTLSCPICGYRSSDIISLERKTPMRYILKIDDPEKLSYRVIRSGNSTIRFPEIGARIDPGTFSEGYITNVEGILRRLRNVLIQILEDNRMESDHPDSETDSSRTQHLISLIDDYIEENIPVENTLSIILEDPMGNSAILGPDNNIVKEKLSEEEVSYMLSAGKG